MNAILTIELLKRYAINFTFSNACLILLILCSDWLEWLIIKGLIKTKKNYYFFIYLKYLTIAVYSF